MRYKIGDKVRIVKERVLNMNDDGKMDKRLGKTMKIINIAFAFGMEHYKMEEDKNESNTNGGYGRHWSDGMIEGLVEQPREPKEGEWVEVKDFDDEEWSKRIFLCTIPGKATFKYIVVKKEYEEEYMEGEVFDWNYFKQIRQIKEPKQTIKIGEIEYDKKEFEEATKNLSPLK